MKKLLILVIFVSILILVHSRYRPTSPFSHRSNTHNKNYQQQQKQKNLRQGPSEYTVHYFEQRVDHFTFNPSNQSHFQQKYLVRDIYWNKQNKGPIFFYCGNEGPVEMFYNNSGFLNYNLGQTFNALIVYMEHRYFGDSWPFGNQTNAFKKENLIYLTSFQALHDYEAFLHFYKKQIGCENCPVIAFGGSYGAMLSSWMRMKFPNIIDGALACSAPIFYFMNRECLNFEIFYNISTISYTANGCNLKIREAYRRLDNYKTNANQSVYNMLNKAFNLCSDYPIINATGIYFLENWLTSAYTYMSMLNYPYETNFLQPLPSWPANTSCYLLSNISTSSPDNILFEAIHETAEIYYNYGGPATCNNIFDTGDSSQENMDGWNILACADMVMPMYSDGVNDMFNPTTWNSTEYSYYCYEEYGVLPRYNWTLEFYGGKTNEELYSYSNIFFSQGMLDPWSGGGPNATMTNSLQGIYMPMCAHHLDLRQPNPLDPPYVNQGRSEEIRAILNWILNKPEGVSQQYADEVKAKVDSWIQQMEEIQ